MELAKVRSGLRKRPGPAAFPAGPRGGPRVSGREVIQARRSRNRCEGEFCVGPFTADAHPRDFEGRRGERLRAGAQSEAFFTLRAPAAGPPPAGGDERGAWTTVASASLILRRALQRRPGLTLRGRAGACRRGRRPAAGAASLETPSPFRLRLALPDFARLFNPYRPWRAPALPGPSRAHTGDRCRLAASRLAPAARSGGFQRPPAFFRCALSCEG